KHYWESRDFTKTTQEPPIGSGPYRIEKFDPGRSITYRRVENWWGRDLPVNKGLFNFDVIHYDYYRDSTIALEAFKAGEYDYRAENSSKNWATAYDISNVKKGLIRKEEITHNRSSGMQAFVFNTRREKFKDPRVRQALALAFDFEWTNANLFYGLFTRTTSYFENSELAAPGTVPDGSSITTVSR
ncbi:ABC transporter substrate-binding protein, partial [uncultured Sulfitobacter sp.]|uniref:ABC transporter substrate-binding protein n=1 Tax=uncultured Sulfitobacter sp. TaxID=191468 RepID=UPI002596047C